MFTYSKQHKQNRPIHRLLDNGYRFAAVNEQGKILKSSRYEYQLKETLKAHPLASIVKIESLLK